MIFVMLFGCLSCAYLGYIIGRASEELRRNAPFEHELEVQHHNDLREGRAIIHPQGERYDD